MDKLKLAKFIKTNHKIVEEYYQKWYAKTTANCETPYKKLRGLFLSAIEATSNGRLDEKYKGLKKFLRHIEKFKNKRRLSFEEFYDAFVKNEKYEISPLIKKLTKLKQIKEKRAAMFLRDAMEIGNTDIFYNLDHSEYHSKYYSQMKIPVDKVIREVICEKIWNTKMKNPEIKKKAKELFGEKRYMLMEDFWFWGHFGTTRKKNEEVKFKFNKEMVGLDPFMDEEFMKKYKLKTKIKEFDKIIKHKGRANGKN